MRIDLNLTKDGRVVASPSGFLDRKQFSKYLQACKNVGARFEKKSNGQVCQLEDVPLLTVFLQQSDFRPNVSPALGAELENHAAKLRKSERLAEERTAKMDFLYPYQREGVRWLIDRDRAMLADEMGLGKTVQALCASGSDRPVMVVCPASVKSVWAREIERWVPDRTVHVLKGKYIFFWPEPGDVVILNYDIIPEALFPYDEPLENTLLVADEAHALKSKKRKRHRNFKKMWEAVEAKGGALWQLTGTPLLNYPPELWNLLDLMGAAKETFGSHRNFMDLFKGTRMGWEGYHWGTPDPNVKKLLRKFMLRRQRKDVLPDLPDKTHDTIKVNGLTDEVIKECDEVVGYLESTLGGSIEDLTLQDLMDFGFEKMSRARMLLASAKVPSMLEIVENYEEQDEPLVVFSAHRVPVEVLGEREGWESITGGVSQEKRTQVIEKFQAGELKGIALTIAAGGTGITLTRSHTALFVDLAWTPAANDQAEDRICRIGQDKGCNIHLLVAEHPLDERVAEILGYKKHIIDHAVVASSVEIVKTASDTFFEVAKLRDDSAPKIRNPRKFRTPENDRERWAVESIKKLAANDPDRAREKNDVGFNAFDGEFGHSLAEQFDEKKGWTDKQYRAAFKILHKYHRQVGTPPEVTNA